MGPRAVVVLDSNILVSALGWRGPPHEVYVLARGESLELVTSQPLLDELERVLRYPKFEFSEAEIGRFLADVKAHARIVRPGAEIRVVADDLADNRVVECAVSGRADWIVSGDEHLLALGEYDRIRIGSARDLLAWMGR